MFLACSENFGKSQPQRSYKKVLIKKSVYNCLNTGKITRNAQTILNNTVYPLLFMNLTQYFSFSRGFHLMQVCFLNSAIAARILAM